ncbi:MAG: ABC transporter ATP-binding protein [Methanobrevibacter sp.]|jgi:ABC-2 type transport system ATP-binding protein|nr:ABC transporter ATP-binding protein [Candidatus Methanovirga aequatorialis]
MGNIIDINSLIKYYGNFKALNRVSFRVEKGQIFGYLGSNGAGKTTTIKILLGLMKASSGEVRVFGGDTFPDTPNSLKLRAAIGSVLEFNGLLEDRTGLDNLIFWAGLYNIDKADGLVLAEKLMDLVQLEEWADVKVGKYSYGMCKRLAIARCLISDPELLILDEPTLGVDPESRHLIRELLKDLSEKGKTIFISSHDLGEIQKICSHLAIIKKGNILFKGSLDDLIKQYADEREFSLEDVYLKIVKEE